MPNGADSTNPAQLAFNRALLAKSERDYAVALASIKEAFRLAPRSFADAKLWAALFNAPAWFATEAEHDTYLGYADGLMAMVENACASSNAEFATHLADQFIRGAQFRHTAHNDRPITDFMTRRAALYGNALSSRQISRAFTFSNPVADAQRPRLGIIFKHLMQDPETTSVLPFFDTAKAAGIEVILFVLEAKGSPAFAARLQAVCDKIVQLPANTTDAVNMLRKADLDIALFGNDITAKPSLPAYLSFFRIARRMCCCVSTLVTTASPQMDVYFGCDYYAARGCATEFTERFMPLPDPGFAFLFPERKTVAAENAVNRKALGISDDALLLTSGANHTKLHRDLVEVWLEILRRVPRASLLLYPFPPHFGHAAEIEQRLRAQFQEARVDQQRLIISPSLPGRDAVIAMLQHVDLGLDSFPYTGVTTIVDAVEACLPTVSLAGRTLRTAQGAAILHSVGLDDLIVEDRRAYVELAVALSADDARREQLRTRMRTIEAPPFFDTAGFGRAVTSAYYQLHAEMRAAG